MLKNIVPAERVVDISYELSFDDGRHNGFGFPCDEDGNVSPTLNPAALENLEYCKAHPEKFIRYGVIDRRKLTWVNPPTRNLPLRGNRGIGQRVLGSL